MPRYNAKNERVKKRYLNDLKEAEQRSGATIDGVRKALLRFEEHTAFADFATFDKEQAVGFKRHLENARSGRTGLPLRRATVLSTLTALQEFLRWLAPQHGYRSKIAVADIRYLNLSRKEVSAARASPTRTSPTPEQIKTVIASMPTMTEVNLRDRALIAFTFVTGIRDGAMATLRLKHVDLDRVLVIQDPNEVDTKFSKLIETFFFPVGPEIERIVIEWVRFLREVKLYGDDDPLFPRTRVTQNAEKVFAVDGIEPAFWASSAPIRAIFRAAFVGAGLQPFTPHTFRSTIVRLGQKLCRTPEQFKAWSQNLGHSDPLTTFTSYGHVDLHRQGELIRSAGNRLDDPAVLDQIRRLVSN